jgi:plasmid maintenance system antidote protein VapI
MEENDLSQADLLDVFGSRSRVSEAVSGKRAISKEQAKRLGDRFRVSPAAFIYSGFQMRATPLVRLRPRRQSLAGVSS